MTSEPSPDPIDLRPATQQIADLVANISDGDLGRPTPCGTFTVGDLLDHFMGLTLAFTMGAKKEADAEALHAESPPDHPDAGNLPSDWKQQLPQRLDALAAAWAAPGAWEGKTLVRVPMPASAAGVTCLDELVVHGWDLATALGQSYTVDPVHLDVVHSFVEATLRPGVEERREWMFDAPVALADNDNDQWRQTLALAGRNPDWQG